MYIFSVEVIMERAFSLGLSIILLLSPSRYLVEGNGWEL